MHLCILYFIYIYIIYIYLCIYALCIYVYYILYIYILHYIYFLSLYINYNSCYQGNLASIQTACIRYAEWKAAIFHLYPGAED